MTPMQNQKKPSMDMTPIQNQKRLKESMKMLRNRKGITDDGNVPPVPFTFILMDTIPIGFLTPTPIHPSFITRTIHSTDIDTIMDTAHRIIATIEAIIRTGTSIVGIIAEVGIHHIHGGLTKKAICASKIDVLAVHVV